MAGNLSVTRSFDRVYSIVRDNVEPILFDNVSTQTSLLYALKLMGAIHRVSGRAHFRFNILKELPTTIGFSDLDPLTPVRGDPVTSCIYEWKQLATPIQVSGRDLIRTDGENGIIDMLELFMQSAEISLREAIGGRTLGIFSDAAEDTLTKITGLQNILGTSTTTGTVGNLSRATLAVWRHKSQNVASAFDTNGLDRFRTLFRQCKRANEVPNITVLTGAAMDNFEKELTSTFQVNLPMMGFGGGDQNMIDAGFPNIRYKGSLIFDDDGVPPNAGYMLNTKYLGLYVHEGRDGEIGDLIKSKDSDDLVSYVHWAGNLCATNLGLMGIIQNSDTY